MPNPTLPTPGLSDQKPIRSPAEILGQAFDLDPQTIQKMATTAVLFAILSRVSKYMTTSETDFYTREASQPFPVNTNCRP